MSNQTLDYLVNKFGLDATAKSPIEIHNINRTIIAKTLDELGLTHGAEIGVAEGLHAEVLCKYISNPILFCIDAYKKYPGYEEYSDPDKCYQEARNRLDIWGVNWLTDFSTEIVKQFRDNELDFVYIDGGHDFLNVAQDICLWSKKVRPGGIVFGHDFKRSKRRPVHVKDVVPAYMYAHNITPWFILTNDIKDPTFGRDNPGWMFVRQEKDQL